MFILEVLKFAYLYALLFSVGYLICAISGKEKHFQILWIFPSRFIFGILWFPLMLMGISVECDRFGMYNDFFGVKYAVDFMAEALSAKPCEVSGTFMIMSLVILVMLRWIQVDSD